MAVEAPPREARPAAPPRPKREREEEVLVWPDLVFIEFIAVVLFSLTFIILSVFINAPLLNRANPDVTPNPSKAPWYFLNLQELLLHMHAAWGGVLVPTIALLFFAAIPYIDRSNHGQGIWFGTKNSVRITIATFIYALIVSFGLVLFDAGKLEIVTRWIPPCNREALHQPPCLWDDEGAAHKGLEATRDLAERLRFSIPVPGPEDGHLDWPDDYDHIPVPFNDFNPRWKNLHLWGGLNINLPATMVEQVIPLSTIFVLAFGWVYILFRIGWVRSIRDVMIVMYTGVMTGYLALTLVGSFLRGPGQALIPPWDIKVDEG